MEGANGARGPNHCPSSGSRGSLLRSWKRRFVGHLAGARARRSRCVVCLQIQQIAGLPPPMEARAVVVGWRTKGCAGERTSPVRVAAGAAIFDEIFLHHCSTDVGSVRRGFAIWVSVADGDERELGAFRVDLSEFAAAGGSFLNSSFGGKSMSFALGGVAHGGVLSLSVYCRMVEDEDHDITTRKSWNKTKCFSCLPDLNCLRSRPASASARRVPALRSDANFITIENPTEDILRMDDEDGGFITLERGTISSRSQRPSSDTLVHTDGDEEEIEGREEEKPCLLMEFSEEIDADKVEDEFLSMLEQKYWKGSNAEPWRKVAEGSLSMSLDLSLDLGLDLDLDFLLKEAEVELAKAAQVWRSKVGAAILEKEEYEDLMRRWGVKEDDPSPVCFV
ncbi:hypothetical protein ACMD2_01406, partial [Ananas comosus]